LAFDVTKALKFLKIGSEAGITSSDPHIANFCRGMDYRDTLLGGDLLRSGSPYPGRQHRRDNKKLPPSHLVTPRAIK
jgi:hypothetical protein